MQSSVAAKCCSKEEKWGVSRSKSVGQMSSKVLSTSGDRVEGQDDALVYVCCV